MIDYLQQDGTCCLSCEPRSLDLGFENGNCLIILLILPDKIAWTPDLTILWARWLL